MRYESAGQFDRAAKKSIRESGREPGAAYREMLRDRFLCRIFSEDDPRFLLKGGAGMLARIPDARATKDVDFAMRERESAGSALEALDRLASKDLGDFCSFRLTSRRESLDENGYSRLLKLRYASYVGDEEKGPILIDLSLDCATTQPAERVTPANRVEIEGVAVFDYLAYPLADQLADKLCAVMGLQPGGWPSSRMKDLVDIVAYATNEAFDLGQLAPCDQKRVREALHGRAEALRSTRELAAAVPRVCAQERPAGEVRRFRRRNGARLCVLRPGLGGDGPRRRCAGSLPSRMVW